MKSKKHVKATLVRPVSIKEYYDHEFIKSDLANPPQVKISSDTRLTVSLKHFQPLFDRVLVQRAVPVKQTKVSIHIPEANQTNKFIATVVAVGPGARGENGKNIPPAVQVGDVVFLPEFGGTKVILEEKEYFLYRDSDFLAKIKPVA
ncbi:GroES chaperonin family [Trinorchestia longiramus]|nr:GroES chaperonin family [Trinorchestia longiramus]